MSMTKKGRCLCGSVCVTARDVPDRATVCHCAMCRRWTGSAFIEVSPKEEGVTWEGQEAIRVFTSSDWGERAFCGTCGTHLYFRVTDGGDFAGSYDIPLGLLDDPSGIALGTEIFVDHKPAAYAFEDRGQKRLTRDDCVALFPKLGDA